MLKNGLTVGALVSEMNDCGVLGAGKVGEASKIVKEMFKYADGFSIGVITSAFLPLRGVPKVSF